MPTSARNIIFYVLVFVTPISLFYGYQEWELSHALLLYALVFAGVFSVMYHQLSSGLQWILLATLTIGAILSYVQVIIPYDFTTIYIKQVSMILGLIIYVYGYTLCTYLVYPHLLKAIEQRQIRKEAEQLRKQQETAERERKLKEAEVEQLRKQQEADDWNSITRANKEAERVERERKRKEAEQLRKQQETAERERKRKEAEAEQRRKQQETAERERKHKEAERKIIDLMNLCVQVQQELGTTILSSDRELLDTYQSMETRSQLEILINQQQFIEFHQFISDIQNDISHIKQKYASSGGHSHQRGSSATCNSIEEAYKILGCTPQTSYKDIKKQYRQLANMWHPDKATQRGIPKEEANQKIKQINSAWDMIK